MPRGIELEDDDFFFILAGAAIVAFAYAMRHFQGADLGGFQFGGSAPATTGPLNQVLGSLPMVVSPQGRDFIKQNEGGFSATPYRDAAGYSIGWGHYFAPGSTPPKSITLAQGETYFESDVATVESTLNDTLLVPVSQDQFDALADLVFDIGAAHWRSSTLLRQLNAGNYQAAAQQFAVWNRSDGKVNSGLVRRRQAETNLFNRGG